jgi:K+-sensing histidine kinase KdpD
MTILNSAAKIVFILMAAAVVVGLFMGKIEAKDFMVLASMAFAFYFVTPSNTNDIAGSGK